MELSSLMSDKLFAHAKRAITRLGRVKLAFTISIVGLLCGKTRNSCSTAFPSMHCRLRMAFGCRSSHGSGTPVILVFHVLMRLCRVIGNRGGIGPATLRSGTQERHHCPGQF